MSKDSIIDMVVAIIQDDIRSNPFDCSEYPVMSKLQDCDTLVLPKSLKQLLSGIIKSKSENVEVSFVHFHWHISKFTRLVNIFVNSLCKSRDDWLLTCWSNTGNTTKNVPGTMTCDCSYINIIIVNTISPVRSYNGSLARKAP